MARFSGPAASSVNDATIDHHSGADSRAERYDLHDSSDTTDHHHVALPLAGAHPALCCTGSVGIVIEYSLDEMHRMLDTATPVASVMSLARGT